MVKETWMKTFLCTQTKIEFDQTGQLFPKSVQPVLPEPPGDWELIDVIPIVGEMNPGALPDETILLFYWRGPK